MLFEQAVLLSLKHNISHIPERLFRYDIYLRNDYSKYKKLIISKMKKLENKVAVITGASKGIGAGIAKSLAEAGASVVVNYASAKAGADKVVEDIVANGGKAIAVQGDVSKADD